MKQLLLLSAISIALNSVAQIDSVNLGVGATEIVFYSLNNGVQAISSNNDWHLAFSVRQINGFTFSETNQATAIRINESNGLQLFRCPGQKLSQFSSIDTSGWQSWQRMHNPDTTWTIGAFNININFSDIFNFGWGEYNSGDHNIYSDSSVYLLVLPDGTFKKLAILNLLYDTAFNIQYSNLDNSNFQTMEVRKTLYTGKNFVYLNLESNRLLDKEPLLNNWDMMFYRYNNTSFNPSNLSQDIGVMTKDADNVFAATGTEASQSCYYGNGYYNQVNLVGKSWMSQPGDTIIPGIAYFIQSSSVGTYKMKFTAFEGASSGVIRFKLSQCGAAGINSPTETDISLSVYPIPALDNLGIGINSLFETPVCLSLTDLYGRIVLKEDELLKCGTNKFVINIQDMGAGLYILNITTNRVKVSQKVLIGNP